MFHEKFREGIISAKQFDRDDVDYILSKGRDMINMKNSDHLNGKMI